MSDLCFDALVERALRKQELKGMRSLVEKELLHYDILFAMERKGYLNYLVFRGGACIRLCYGASRYSENLDFVADNAFDDAEMYNLASALTDYLSGKYRLEVYVKTPSELKVDSNPAENAIDKWRINIITQQTRSDLPWQEVKIDVAKVPAHTGELRTLKQYYDFLPDGYDEFLLHVETRDEILADKLVAYTANLDTHIRYQDIWDMAWLSRIRAQVDDKIVEKKVSEYGITNFKSALICATSGTPEITASETFRDELGRLLPRNVAERTLSRGSYVEYLSNTSTEMLEKLRKSLFEPKPPPSPFSFV